MPNLPQSARQPRYALARHAFACLDSEHVVLLDVRKDRYMALDEAKSRCLAGLVRGWPTGGAESAHGYEVEPAQAERVAQTLLSHELLEGDRGAGKDATPVRIEEPTHGFAPDDYLDWVKVPARAVFAFVMAVAFAQFATRFWTFEHMIRRVRRRNDRDRSRLAPIETRRLEALVAIFGQLRPWLFSSRDACLFESLALIEFLARQGICARWVFGVQARPFAAHCWVQRGSIVLSDSMENARGFTPIMVV